MNLSTPTLRPTRDQAAAFTLNDLVTLLATLVILAGLTAFSNGDARIKGQTATCRNNLRQLALAWQSYADDFSGKLPGNLDGSDASSFANSNRTWCVGWLDFYGGTSGADTNWQVLMASQLGPYAKTPRIYKCPADTSLSRGRTGVPRVRSVSMNGYLGDRSGPYTSGYRQFKLLSQIVDPRPSEAFVFIDEREDSINDALLQIDMTGYSPSLPTAYTMVDFPADWHNGGADLSFVDGHTETWRWQDRRTIPAHTLGQPKVLGVASPNSLDVARIQRATSRRVR